MSNLLQKASIVTTPTAYGVGVLNSIKPAQSFGEELVVPMVHFATDSDWALSSGSVISNGKAIITVTAGGFQYISQNQTYISGRKYKFTAVVKGTSGKGMRFQDNLNNTGGLTTTNGAIVFDGNLQNLNVVFTANSTSNTIAGARSGTGDYSFENRQRKRKRNNRS